MIKPSKHPRRSPKFSSQKASRRLTLLVSATLISLVAIIPLSRLSCRNSNNLESRQSTFVSSTQRNWQLGVYALVFLGCGASMWLLVRLVQTSSRSTISTTILKPSVPVNPNPPTNNIPVPPSPKPIPITEISCLINPVLTKTNSPKVTSDRNLRGIELPFEEQVPIY